MNVTALGHDDKAPMMISCEVAYNTIDCMDCVVALRLLPPTTVRKNEQLELINATYFEKSRTGDEGKGKRGLRFQTRRCFDGARFRSRVTPGMGQTPGSREHKFVKQMAGQGEWIRGWVGRIRRAASNPAPASGNQQ